jgi:hypothetical protein
MSTKAKIIIFGIISGLIWSLIALGFTFFNLVKDFALISSAGILTGLAVSFLLKVPLTKFGRWWTLVFGLVSLPLGAFIFGIVFSLLNLSEWLNGSQYEILNAVLIGGEFALISVANLWAIFLFPLAIITTFLLRVIIHPGENIRIKI